MTTNRQTRATNTTCPGTIAKRNPETGTHNARPRDPRRTTYPLRRVCGNCKIIVQRSPPRNATYECNPPKPQPNEARPPAVHQTKPRRKTTGNADGTTHPPKRVCGNMRFLPSVKTHPTSTQTSPQYAQPPKPGIPGPEHDDRRYRSTTHPLRRVCGNNLYTKAPKEQQELLFWCFLCFFFEKLMGYSLIDLGTLSQRENPRTKKGRAQPPATRNPIQEPATTAQKTSSTHPLRRVCGNFKFVILTQHPRPRRTNTGERRPARQTNPTNGNESKPQCKPWTNPTPAEAGILLNPHPPTKAMTPPTENTMATGEGEPQQ
ncbi:hypothetical protein BS47DRAFT_1362467 [Hydnum rufescens UP504]|uniref:Uncharacterized protein n=1 Tax=Hydnum rufescens UP504 TaxID=1448309 RepID=A0A9P6DSL4_9AGAM|nr:hypothetical protein BS47DRAFT_1362467 [Hydnum rufescens UP504]